MRKAGDDKMPKSMRIGRKNFPLGERTYIMGILNVTPDSFSDGGKHNLPGKAAEHALRMLEEGADIIDVGGESTRPNYIMVSDEEEIARVVPVVEAIRRVSDIPISIDTYKSRVAAAACEAGADMINDIWGLLYDPDMADTVKKYNTAVCIMHNGNKIPQISAAYYKDINNVGITNVSINYRRINNEGINNEGINSGSINNVSKNNGSINSGSINNKTISAYLDYYSGLVTELRESLSIASKAGIDKSRIMLDPGIGFGKTYEMNLWLINNLEQLHELGYPILLGTSRKSVIGITLDEPADNRLEGTIATSVIAVMKGCQFLRVHDVRENIRAVRMTEAILKAGG